MGGDEGRGGKKKRDILKLRKLRLGSIPHLDGIDVVAHQLLEMGGQRAPVLF